MESENVSKLIDIVGRQFGNWLVLERSENHIIPSGASIPMYLCECQCKAKTRKIISGATLRHGNSKSCDKCRDKAKYKLRKYNKYTKIDNYYIGYTSKGEKFYFDEEDYDLVRNYSWHLNDGGYVIANSHITDGKTKAIRMHRLIMEKYCNINKKVIDHIGGYNTRNDNRKSNLRISNKSGNAANSDIRNTNTSGVTGVCWNKKANKWMARITYNNKDYYLGLFDELEDAIAARKKAEDKYFGDFSYANSMRIYNQNEKI